MATEHDYFGLIGDYWSERVAYGDQDVEVVLDADEDLVAVASLDIAAGMIGDLELIDDALRDAFLAQLDAAHSPTVRFLNRIFSGDDAAIVDDAVARSSGDRHVDALRSLRLLRVDIRPDSDDHGDTFAEFEYALAPEDLDARLVAAIDVERDIVGVRFEA